jgi:AraC-like DNA-binding protein
MLAAGLEKILNGNDMGPMDSGTRLWLPPLALAGCVRAAMVHDTRGRNFSVLQSENYFPAVPLVTLSLWFEGHVVWLDTPGFSAPNVGYSFQPLMVHGPFTVPSHTRNEGPGCTIFLLFLPDAFAALTGVDPGSLLNTVVDARAVLPADWLHWLPSLMALPDSATRLAAIEAFLRLRWQGEWAKRPAGQRFGEWAQALAVRAATSATGRSVRQMERRIKAWAGLPMREIHLVSRAERAFMAAAPFTTGLGSTGAAAGAAPAGVNWADIAAQTDYADQSHLCRDTRRITGFSPEQLMQRGTSEEAFWPYRLWR